VRQASLKAIFQLAKKDKKIIFIGSDLGPGILEEMKQKYPDRFFMEGITEQGIIGMAAGLALEGFKPFVNNIGTFLTRRCYEQIVVDIAMHNLPVRLVANGAGYVYAPLGPTHLAIDDITIMRCIPNMIVISPCDAIEMKKIIYETQKFNNPIYIRMGKGGDKIITSEKTNIKIGQSRIIKNSNNAMFATTGVMTQIAISACEILKKEYNFNAGVVHFNTIKPLDKKNLFKILKKIKCLVSVEENNLIGGFGSAILEACNDNNIKDVLKFHRLGLPDSFSKNYGTQDELLKSKGITPQDLARKLLFFLKKKNINKN
jgi:transketolase